MEQGNNFRLSKLHRKEVSPKWAWEETKRAFKGKAAENNEGRTTECRCLEITIENLKHQVDHFIFFPEECAGVDSSFFSSESCGRKLLATYPEALELLSKLLFKSV